MTGGTPDLTYTLRGSGGESVSAVLPELAFDANTRTLSGTPTSAVGDVMLTYAVRDSASASDTQNILFTVNTPSGPLAFAATPLAAPAFTVNHPGSLTLPAASGASGTYTYTLTGADGQALADAVPGLTFDATATTRELSGTASKVADAVMLTYTVTDATDATDAEVTQTFSITINVAVTLPEVVDNLVLSRDVPFGLTLPPAMGGTGRLTYFLLGPGPDSLLPPGLRIYHITGMLVGTPTHMGTTTVRYVAQDVYGAGDEVNFDIIVTADPASAAWTRRPLPSIVRSI